MKTPEKDFKKKSYMLFKSVSNLKEIMGMRSLIPRRGLVDDVEMSEVELTAEPLPWGSTETVTGPKSSIINRR